MENIKINNQKDILKIGLQDVNGVNILDEKGEQVYWAFDLTDIELPLKYARVQEEHEQNLKWIKSQIIAIDKKQDSQGKSFLSKNEELKIKAMKEFYEKEIKALNKFLGDKGVEKFLNGRSPYYEVFEDIAEALESILPLIQKNITSISDRIKNKYKDEKENVLE